MKYKIIFLIIFFPCFTPGLVGAEEVQTGSSCYPEMATSSISGGTTLAELVHCSFSRSQGANHILLKWDLSGQHLVAPVCGIHVKRDDIIKTGSYHKNDKGMFIPFTLFSPNGSGEISPELFNRRGDYQIKDWVRVKEDDLSHPLVGSEFYISCCEQDLSTGVWWGRCKAGSKFVRSKTILITKNSLCSGSTIKFEKKNGFITKVKISYNFLENPLSCLSREVLSEQCRYKIEDRDNKTGKVVRFLLWAGDTLIPDPIPGTTRAINLWNAGKLCSRYVNLGGTQK